MSSTNPIIYNSRVASVQPSATLALTSKANAMKKAGEKVCSFGAGEPDFDTPEHIKEAAIKALREGQTKYGPSAGLLSLRQAIARKLQRDNRLNYTPEQIVVSNGAKHSLYNFIMAVCRDGDEVLVPAPYWLSYPEMISMAGGKPVFVLAQESNDFKVTPAELRRAITPNTRAVIINSPSNPIGNVYSRDELAALAQVAVEHDLFIIADEIYEKTLYDGAVHTSIASISPDVFSRTVTINGFSKAYAMPGWRLGYLAAPLEIAKKIDDLQSHSTSGPNTFVQYGAIAALEGPQTDLESMVKAFDERRRYMYDRLTAIKGVRCIRPLGAFYLLPNISAFGMKAASFAEALLAEEKVVVVPGESFGSDKHIRLSYACGMDNIKEGMDRLTRFMTKKISTN